MTAFMITTLVLLGVTLALQFVLLLRGGAQNQSVHRRIDEQTRGLADVAASSRDARTQGERIETALAESRGRLAGISEHHIKVGEALIGLQQMLPLQIADGVTRLDEGATTRDGALRQELVDTLARFGESLAALQGAIPLKIAEGIKQLDESATARDGSLRNELAERSTGASRDLREQLESALRLIADTLTGTRTDLMGTLSTSAETADKRMQELRAVTDGRLSELVTRYTDAAKELNSTAQKTTTTVTDRLAELKGTVDKVLKDELGAIRGENATKLDEMRKTVDEKLHETLEKRLGDSFKIVSDRLEQVHRGLGEMQSLATGVGDLKKVLTNIKTRGTWGEVQLDALLEQILTQDQYAKNIECRPNSGLRVEFAIRLPGRGDAPLLLPIDAKFPMEDYQRLVDAQDRADLLAVDEANKALEARVKLEARNIRERYIDPPNTTDFAILYLPTEGLYAEVLRRPGLCEWCQRECKVNLTGPTTLGALLNSLQMGFRTLTIEKHSSRIWAVLGAVKTEFAKFGLAIAHTKKKLEQAHSSLEETEKRNRVLGKKLKSVETVSGPEAKLLVADDLAVALATEVSDDVPAQEPV